MAPEADEALDYRVLIVAPVGRDAALTRSILARASIASAVCGDLDALCGEIARGAGALLMTDEALAHPGLPRVLALLKTQPPWSDLPIVLCTHGHGATRAGARRLLALEGVGNVSLLERPIRVRTLISVARAAIHARHRQYEVRGLMTQLAAGIRQRDEASRAKDEFLAVVSHELRTPLNAILGWARMLRSTSFDAGRRERGLEIIERNARVQTQLIEDLLDVSRITSGKMKLSRAPVDLRAVIASALDTVRSDADARGVRISTSSEDGAETVIGDADRLQQVVWNLVANAVKFTPRDGRVHVALRRAGASAVIAVEDTGVGIDVEFLPHVFEQFRQAETGTTRSIGGLGLGLAIAKSLVELHGGSIAAESEGRGKGARFLVTLPMSGSSAPSTRASVVPAFEPPPALAHELSPRLEGARVLVLDDEEDARELLRTILEGHGVIVDMAGSADEAFELLRRSTPDVIVSDIGMPEEDGYTFMQRVRKLPADRGGLTPAVALTAYTRVEDRTRALLAGFNVHLAKPVDATELVVLVANLCGRLTRTAS